MTTDYKRPSWVQTWMTIAEKISERSYDPRLQVGTVIVSEDNATVVSVGYNGNYSGGPHVPASLDEGKSEFLHSELNALLKCDFNFPKKKVMYVTHFPCRMCCKAIVNGGISYIVYKHVYRDMGGLEILEHAGIRAVCYDDIVQEKSSS